MSLTCPRGIVPVALSIEFEDIVNKSTDCYYLLDKLPSHLLDLKASKRRKNMRKKIQLNKCSKVL
jgi:hypothetical protein